MQFCNIYIRGLHNFHPQHHHWHPLPPPTGSRHSANYPSHSPVLNMNPDALRALSQDIAQCPLSVGPGSIEFFSRRSQGEGIVLPMPGPLLVTCLWGVPTGSGQGILFQISDPATPGVADGASVYITGLSDFTPPEIVRKGLAISIHRLANVRHLSMVQLHVATILASSYP